MKRSDLLLLLWAVGGIALAVLFFVSVHREGHLNWRSEVFLLACFLWSQLLRRIPGSRAKRKDG